MEFGVKDELFGGRCGRIGAIGLMLIASVGLSGCMKTGALGGVGETYQSGYVASPMALEQIPVGSSKDQVLLALGTPSTTAQYGGEVFYYISQTRERPVAFMNQKVVDQRILAVYFDKKSNVERVANYGLQDGKVFDFVTKTTPTAGRDQGFLEQVLSGTVGLGNPLSR